MKKEKLKKKLAVNKMTLTNLDYIDQYHVQAGGTVQGRSCDGPATDCKEPTCVSCGCETETIP